MQMNESLKKILITRHYLLLDETKAETNADLNKYLNAYLLTNFGIIVDKPALLAKDMINQIDEEFHLNVPKSFYNNPQDTKYFSCEELLFEQVVSYFAYGSDLGRIEIFKKDLPEYVVGDELKLRTFYIVIEEEVSKILSEITDAYCAYTRPFSLEEMQEFVTLFTEGFYSGKEISCKDNIIEMLYLDKSLARFLDKKDIVKLSIHTFGDKADFKAFKSSPVVYKELKPHFDRIASYIPYVKNCPLTKKQAKYFNKIISMSGAKISRVSNDQSPDRQAIKLLSEGNVVAAADIYAANGSMLERRIKMLLSRANPQEAVEILNKLPANNPIVLYQLLTKLSEDDSKARTFTYFYDNKVRTYKETEYEAKYRKSRLNESTRKYLASICIDKIKEYYKSLPSLGNIYVADNFYKLGMPTNTSASGKGIDVLPIGSRLPCIESNIRTFVHWQDAFDIDSSLIIVDKDNNLTAEGWFSYHNQSYGSDIRFSGDITGSEGTEYFDINIDSLAAKGYKYVIQTFHGYNSRLDHGEIYAGYQNKKNLNTKAWDPKNIEMQFRVQGDSRGCIAFAIDIQKREVIILNQIIDDDGRVVRPEGFKTIEKYLQPDYLTINLGMIAECRGKVVDSPEEADIVFDDKYTAVDISESITDEAGNIYKPQTVIRSYELEKLVSFINN